MIRHHTHPDRLRQALSAALLDTPRDKRIKTRTKIYNSYTVYFDTILALRYIWPFNVFFIIPSAVDQFLKHLLIKMNIPISVKVHVSPHLMSNMSAVARSLTDDICRSKYAHSRRHCACAQISGEGQSFWLSWTVNSLIGHH